MSKVFITLKKNAEFRKVYGEGRSAVNKRLVVYAMENGLSTNRFGITISRKVGKAAIRNKVRRRIREILRLFFLTVTNSEKAPCFDIIIVARHSAPEADFAELKGGLVRLLPKLLHEKRKEEGSE
jgi:ribonuclease P protein component